MSMIDAVHQRPEGTAGHNFRKNKSQFIEGVDNHELTLDEIRRPSMEGASGERISHGLVFTEYGYLMLVKSLNDGLAWKVQRDLMKALLRNYHWLRTGPTKTKL